MLVNYSSNNSGGDWWLSDDDWFRLEKAGWKVEWVKDKENSPFHLKGQDRWLGALAVYASKEAETPGAAMREFEEITGQTVSDEGCDCCGAPHSFSWYENEVPSYASGQECSKYVRDTYSDDFE